MIDLSESRILLVDDVKANIDVLVQALRDDYKLSVALNGDSALRSAEKNPPDFVLLDIMMPGMDGNEVCRWLRASPAVREVPVMCLSALEEVANKTRGFEVGGTDYLTKPFEILEVKARVRSLLKAKAYTDAAREKLASELRIAREIQLGILPADVSGCTGGTGLDIHAVMEPAKDVGGDLYEVLRLADGRILIVVGDVSGKGIPAALFMAVTTTLIRTLARQLRTTDEIVLQMSDALAAHNPRNMFVTLCCVALDMERGTVICTSAGHPSPVLVRPGCAPTLPLGATAMIAGFEPGMEVGHQEINWRPGDKLVFYTDGVTEAFNAAGEMFGESRLLEQLAAAAEGSAAETTPGVLAAVRRHAGDCPQSDDITILTVGWKVP